MHGLPSDYYNNYLARLEAVTAEDVMRVSKEYMRTRTLLSLLLGKLKVVAGLAAFGTVEYFNAEGQTTDAPTFLFMPEGVTLRQFLVTIMKRWAVLMLPALSAIDMKAHLEIPGMPGKIKMRTAKMTPASL